LHERDALALVLEIELLPAAVLALLLGGFGSVGSFSGSSRSTSSAGFAAITPSRTARLRICFNGMKLLLIVFRASPPSWASSFAR